VLDLPFRRRRLTARKCGSRQARGRRQKEKNFKADPERHMGGPRKIGGSPENRNPDRLMKLHSKPPQQHGRR